MPAVTEPPGLLMYSQMSVAASSPSRYSSWAQIWLAMSSLTSVPSMITRFFSSLLNTSLRGSKPGSSASGRVVSDMETTLAAGPSHPAEHHGNALGRVDVVTHRDQAGEARGTGVRGVDPCGRPAQLVRV